MESEAMVGGKRKAMRTPHSWAFQCNRHRAELFWSLSGFLPSLPAQERALASDLSDCSLLCRRPGQWLPCLPTPAELVATGALDAGNWASRSLDSHRLPSLPAFPGPTSQKSVVGGLRWAHPLPPSDSRGSHVGILETVPQDEVLPATSGGIL